MLASGTFVFLACLQSGTGSTAECQPWQACTVLAGREPHVQPSKGGGTQQRARQAATYWRQLYGT